MFMAVPCRVIEVTGSTALVEHLGRRREVNLDLLDQPVQPGDHLLVDVSGYAVERCDPAPERRALALLKRVSDRARGGDLGGLAA